MPLAGLYAPFPSLGGRHAAPTQPVAQRLRQGYIHCLLTAWAKLGRPVYRGKNRCTTAQHQHQQKIMSRWGKARRDVSQSIPDHIDTYRARSEFLELRTHARRRAREELLELHLTDTGMEGGVPGALPLAPWVPAALGPWATWRTAPPCEMALWRPGSLAQGKPLDCVSPWRKAGHRRCAFSQSSRASLPTFLTRQLSEERFCMSSLLHVC